MTMSLLFVHNVMTRVVTRGRTIVIVHVDQRRSVVEHSKKSLQFEEREWLLQRPTAR
jgi:hypothetical protein